MYTSNSGHIIDCIYIYLFISQSVYRPRVILHLSCTASCLNLRNAFVPLMMLLATQDTDACANGTELPQNNVAPHIVLEHNLVLCI